MGQPALSKYQRLVLEAHGQVAAPDNYKELVVAACAAMQSGFQDVPVISLDDLKVDLIIESALRDFGVAGVRVAHFPKAQIPVADGSRVEKLGECWLGMAIGSIKPYTVLVMRVGLDIRAYHNQD